MKIYAKQIKQGGNQFLLVTDGDPKTRASKGLVVHVENKTVERVRDLRSFTRQSSWKPLTASDPTLENLVTLVPALRPYRGIEVCLPDGSAAWIRWKQWSSDNPATLELLAKTTRTLTIPPYELDGDYYLASQAIAALGGKVLDPPRSVVIVPEDTY